jgi:hypothetical protein
MYDQIDVRCPECGETRRVAANFVGRAGECTCGEVFIIEETDQLDDVEQDRIAPENVVAAIDLSEPDEDVLVEIDEVEAGDTAGWLQINSDEGWTLQSEPRLEQDEAGIAESDFEAGDAESATQSTSAHLDRKCDVCGETVSPTAETCPHCAALKSGDSRSRSETSGHASVKGVLTASESRDRFDKGTLVCVVGAVAFLSVVMLAPFYFTSIDNLPLLKTTQNPSQSQTAPPEGRLTPAESSVPRQEFEELMVGAEEHISVGFESVDELSIEGVLELDNAYDRLKPENPIAYDDWQRSRVLHGHIRASVSGWINKVIKWQLTVAEISQDDTQASIKLEASHVSGNSRLPLIFLSAHTRLSGDLISLGQADRSLLDASTSTIPGYVLEILEISPNWFGTFRRYLSYSDSSRLLVGDHISRVEASSLRKGDKLVVSGTITSVIIDDTTGKLELVVLSNVTASTRDNIPHTEDREVVVLTEDNLKRDWLVAKLSEFAPITVSQLKARDGERVQIGTDSKLSKQREEALLELHVSILDDRTYTGVDSAGRRIMVIFDPPDKPVLLPDTSVMCYGNLIQTTNSLPLSLFLCYAMCDSRHIYVDERVQSLLGVGSVLEIPDDSPLRRKVIERQAARKQREVELQAARKQREVELQAARKQREVELQAAHEQREFLEWLRFRDLSQWLTDKKRHSMNAIIVGFTGGAAHLQERSGKITGYPFLGFSLSSQRTISSRHWERRNKDYAANGPRVKADRRRFTLLSGKSFDGIVVDEWDDKVHVYLCESRDDWNRGETIPVELFSKSDKEYIQSRRWSIKSKEVE